MYFTKIPNDLLESVNGLTNSDLEKYINNSSLLENDFIAEFDKHIVKLRSTGEFSMLFGKGVDITEEKTALETLEDKIAKKEKNYAQELADFQTMSDKDFKTKYGTTRKIWAELNGKEYKER